MREALGSLLQCGVKSTAESKILWSELAAIFYTLSLCGYQASSEELSLKSIIAGKLQPVPGSVTGTVRAED